MAGTTATGERRACGRAAGTAWSLGCPPPALLSSVCCASRPTDLYNVNPFFGTPGDLQRVLKELDRHGGWVGGAGRQCTRVGGGAGRWMAWLGHAIHTPHLSSGTASLTRSPHAPLPADFYNILDVSSCPAVDGMAWGVAGQLCLWC